MTPSGRPINIRSNERLFSYDKNSEKLWNDPGLTHRLVDYTSGVLMQGWCVKSPLIFKQEILEYNFGKSGALRQC